MLERPFASRRLALLTKTAHEVLADYLEVIELVESDEAPQVVLTDPSNNQVIAAALAAKANCIGSMR